MKKILDDVTIDSIIKTGCVKKINELYLIYKDELDRIAGYFYNVKKMKYDYDFNDITSAFYIGFRRSLSKYDIQKGKFETFVYYYLKREVYDMYRDKMIRVPNNAKKLKSSTKYAYEKSLRSVDTLNFVISDKHGVGLTLGDIIPCNQANTEREAITNVILDNFYDYCHNRELNDLKRGEIFYDWMTSDFSLTYLGKKHKLCKERIRQIRNYEEKKWKEVINN